MGPLVLARLAGLNTSRAFSQVAKQSAQIVCRPPLPSAAVCGPWVMEAKGSRSTQNFAQMYMGRDLSCLKMLLIRYKTTYKASTQPALC